MLGLFARPSIPKLANSNSAGAQPSGIGVRWLFCGEAEFSGFFWCDTLAFSGVSVGGQRHPA
jgi:hypothetical protein